MAAYGRIPCISGRRLERLPQGKPRQTFIASNIPVNIACAHRKAACKTVSSLHREAISFEAAATSLCDSH